MTHPPRNPYQILGVSSKANSKEITVAYAKALSAGKYDKTTLVEALSSLNNEAKRAEVDVLIVGEPALDLSAEFGPIDSDQLLKALATDLPSIDLTIFAPWAELLPVPPMFEPSTIEPSLPEPQTFNTSDAEPPIEFPL
jgi:hypothetical protein